MRSLIRPTALLLAFHGIASVAGQEAVPPDAVQVESAIEVDADLLNGEAGQYEQMLRPKMWRELEFIKQHCNLTREQRPKIKAAANASVKNAAKGLLQQMQRPGNQTDPTIVIRKDLLAALEATLNKEQLARYHEQSARRTAAVKKTTIKSVVAQLDGYLYLTRDQRDKISEALDSHWQEGWEKWLVVWQYGGTHFPMIPDQRLVPYLDEKQKSVWQGAQRVDPGFWDGGGMRQEANNDWWEGKETSDDKPPVDQTKPQAKAG